MSNEFQESLFLPEYRNDWKAPTDFPRWWEAKEVTIDVETHDPNLKKRGPGWHNDDGEIIGIGIGVEGDARYYPIAHHAGGNLDKGMVLQWVRDVSRTQSKKIFFNASYDIGWLSTVGVDVGGSIFDAAASAALLDESRTSYSLDALCETYTNERKDYAALKEAATLFGINAEDKDELMGSLWQLPANAVGPYGEGDIRSTFALYQAHKKMINAQGLDGLMKTECALIPCLVAMRKRGVLIDQDAAAQLKTQLRQSLITTARQQITDYGKRIDPYSGQNIAAKCDQLGIDYPIIEKTGNPSFTKDWLETQAHPFLVHIREYRKLQTNKSLLESIVYQYLTDDGRIHCNFNALKSDDGGTVTGRFSSSKPNLQQVPMRHPVWGQAFRKLFLPDVGTRWCSADYSQQEYRLIVHFARLLRLPGAKEAARMYAKEGADFHAIVAKMIDRPRYQAKEINFGIAYTMGEELLASKLGLSVEEARPILSQYHEHAPFIKKLTQAISNVAAKRGYVKTIGGRRCRFNEWEPMNSHRMDPRPRPVKSREEAIEKWGQRVQRAWLHKACNRVIQGSGADITKPAMLSLYEAGIVPSLQVHDELDICVDNDRQPSYIKEVMEHTIETSPAMVVDVSLGDNWAEAH